MKPTSMSRSCLSPDVPTHACLCNLCLLIRSNQMLHLNNHIWSLNLNLVFKPTSFNLLLVALAQTTAYCHVTFMHHIVALHWFCSPLFAGICPLSVDDVPTMRSMTPMKSYVIFKSARQAKPPCSFRYNPTLSLLLSFTALGQQRFNCYLLR